MRFEGSIKTWNEERGFGFIEPTLGGDEIFVHVKAFARGHGRPGVGQFVSFEVELGPHGKKRAASVQALRKAHTRRRQARGAPGARAGATWLVIFALILICLAVQIVWRPPAIVALFYLVASVTSFLVYAFDKSAARRGARRIPEAWLHALALAGGWPGALLAQQYLRHKSSKASFRSVFWGTVVINLAIFIVLCAQFAHHRQPDHRRNAVEVRQPPQAARPGRSSPVAWMDHGLVPV